jgi:hypothetical protein
MSGLRASSGLTVAQVDELEKIDNAAVDGLTGVSNSLAYRVAEVERHLHSGARWFETAAVPDGEAHVADRIGSGAGAFQIDSGDQTWGEWVQVLGSSDTPVDAGKVYFDPHLMTISDNERAGIYFVQFTRGDSGAAGLAAGRYTELALDITTRAGGTYDSAYPDRTRSGGVKTVGALYVSRF